MHNTGPTQDLSFGKQVVLGGGGLGAVSGHPHAEIGQAKWGWEVGALTLLPKTNPSKPGVSPVKHISFFP